MAMLTFWGLEEYKARLHTLHESAEARSTLERADELRRNGSARERSDLEFYVAH